MNESTLIPIIYARVIGRTAASNSTQLARVLEDTGLDFKSGSSQSNGMSVAQYRKLLSNAIKVSGDSLIALRAASNLMPTIHGPLGIAANSCPTLNDSIQVITRYARLRSPFSHVWIEQKSRTLELNIEISKQLGEQQDAAFDFMVSSIVRNIQPALSEPLSRCDLLLQRPKPSNYRDYQNRLPCGVHYGQSSNALVFAHQDLSIELLGANEELYKTAIQTCRSLLSPNINNQSLVNLIQLQFQKMSGQICSIDTIADQLMMSTRTVQRSLKANGLSFQQLRDEWLAEQASHYLLEQKLTVDVTATLLGYQDEANFRRAFKRWYSCSPRQYRAKH